MSFKSNSENRSFYKYLAPDTALAVFTNKTFRFSSPLLFNDPFDIQSGLYFSFAVEDIYLKILDRLETIAKEACLPDLDWTEPWAQVIKIVWENYPIHGFPRQKWLEQIERNFCNLTLHAEMLQTREGIVVFWDELLPRLRVFCVSEDRDNLLMWAHYAKNHTGVVLEVLSLPEEDNALSVAKSVIYQDSPPQFFTEDEWVDEILLQKELNLADLSREYALFKSTHWSYEKEWRVWYPSGNTTDSGLWTDVPIRASEIKAVYFGCRVEKNFERELGNLISSAFPKVEMFKAEKLAGKYGLLYKKI